MFDYEKDVKANLWEEVCQEFKLRDKGRTISVSRNVEMANRETNTNLIPTEDGDNDVSDY